jgi:putative transcriptional regulator
MRVTLRHIRQERGLSQAAVASRTGISRSYYTLIELERRTPSVDDAGRIARVLGSTVDELFPLPTDPKPREVAGS